MTESIKIKLLNPIYDYVAVVVLIVGMTFFLPIRESIVLSFTSATLIFALSCTFRRQILFWNVIKYVIGIIGYGIMLLLVTKTPDEIAEVMPSIVIVSVLVFMLIFQHPIKKFLKKNQIAPRYFEEFFRLARMFLFSFITYIVLFFVFSNQVTGQLFAEELLCIMLIIIVIYEFIRETIIKINLRKEEWFPIVDEKGSVLGKVEKRESLFSKEKYLHPIIRVHIIFNNTIYLQKTSSNDLIFPDKWDTAISNHVLFGETLDQCIVRTAKQHYGLENIKPIYLNKYMLETENEKQLAFVYYMKGTEDLKPIDKKHIQMGKYWTIKQIGQEFDSGIFTANFIHEFEVLCEKILDCNDLLEE